MNLLILVLLALAALPFIGGCTQPSSFDVLRSKVEDLGPELHERATWRDIWSSLIPRGEYPKGAGYVRSTFQVGRSEPGTDEESWETIQTLAANANGANITTYNQVYVGQHEDTYKPEKIGLMGPLLNQDDLTLQWNSDKFWAQFFMVLEKRNLRTISNRLGNIYRQYSYKASANGSFAFVQGTTTTQPAPQCVDLTNLLPPNQPTSELTQEMLDAAAEELMQEGAQDGDTNGWITMGEQGPEFPLYVGTWMSNRLAQNNSEFRSDLNASFMGREDMNPVIKRVGALRTLKNFRHIPNLFPARWALVGHGQTINYTSRGMNSTTNVVSTASASINNTTGVATITVTLSADSSTTSFTTTGANSNCYIRIPTYCQSTNSLDVTKGQVPVVNGCWRDPSVAKYESVEILNPLVMTEQILMPVNSLPGAKLNAQNYYGEWTFATGNDALLGINGCTGITDPLHKQGRHFAEYRHAMEPVFPIFGRMILWSRCAASFDTISCS